MRLNPFHNFRFSVLTCFISQFIIYTPVETSCYTGEGELYRGNINLSASGHSCQEWFATNYSLFVPYRSYNYCRNPSGLHNKPWCITTLSSMHWEPCAVPKCVRPTIANSSYPLGSMPSLSIK